MNRFVVILFFFPSFLFSQEFYDPDRIQKIEVQFSQPNWDYILDTLKSGKDNYLKATWVKINGKQLFDVGVKYKGNSSYDSTYKKNPLHIELNTFIDQDYQGITDIKLGNSYADPSMIREVMSYNLLKNYMDCPQSNFAQVYINGVYRGLYSNAESVNNRFCRNYFYSDKDAFVKCNPILTPAPNVKSNLKYISPGDSSSYYNYYEMKSNGGWKSLAALCDSITNKPGNMASIVDVDRMIWMLAFNTLLVNLDSYNGAFAQNYYLYKDLNQRFVPIPWDLNMSFGGFPFLGNSNTSLASLSISNMQSLPLSIHSNDSYWPLIKAIHANPTYKKMHLAHFKTILEEYFANNQYLTDYQKYKTLIDTCLVNDTNMFFSYAQFQNALNTNYSVGTYSVPGLQTLMSARVAYLQSTPEFTFTAPSIQSVSVLQSPALNSPISITAQVSNANSNGVSLAYRFKSSKNFQKIVMYDDGLHQDGNAGDGKFGATFTLSSNQAQYYIYAENNNAGMFSPQQAEHEFYEIKVFPHPEKGEVVINEFLAENTSDVRNEFNMLADWVELYNNSDHIICLDDYYLSDTYNDRTLFSFPASATLSPHGFLAVWADEVIQGVNQLHANFNLNKNGDHIILSDGKALVLDSIGFSDQSKDQSTGRCSDGLGNFVALKYPSYLLPNCIVRIDDIDKESMSLLIYPNPAMDQVTLKTDQTLIQHLSISNGLGVVLMEAKFDNLLQISTLTWPNGVYFVSCNSLTKKLIINR